MNELLTPQILVALVGGAVGSARNFTREGAKPRLSEGVVNLLVGEIFAAAAAARFAHDAHLAMAAVIGLGGGAVGGYALDAIQASIPEFIRRVALGWSDRLGGKKDDS